MEDCMPGVSDVLKNVTADDMHIDHLGRVVITRPDVADQLAKAGVKPASGLDQAAGNIICTGSMPAASRELLSGLKNVGGGG
jgi:hypothetical protein